MDPASDIHIPAPQVKRDHTAALEPELTALALAQETSQMLRALLGLRLADIGLALGQDRLLQALQSHDRLSVSALAGELNVRPSTVSKMLDRLESKGFTSRSSDGGDARRTMIELTDDGRAIAKKVTGLSREIETELLAPLDPNAVRRMVEGVGILHDAVGQRLRRLR